MVELTDTAIDAALERAVPHMPTNRVRRLRATTVLPTG